MPANMLALSEDLFEGRSFASFCQDSLSSDLYEELQPTKQCGPDLLEYSVDDESCYLEESHSLVPSCSTSVASSEQSDSEYVSCLDLAADLSDRDAFADFCLDNIDELDYSSTTRRNRRLPTWRNDLEGYMHTSERRLSSPRRQHSNKVKWSALTAEEQVASLENMIQTVSQRLGLREQIELIKMISPDANVLPTDTEFFIDLELFDDEKFSLVSDFIARRLQDVSNQDKEETRNRRQHSPIKRERKNRSKADKSNTSLWTKRKRESLALTKTCKQLRKEKRSGLFLKEEVISLRRSRKDSDCDDEIDIIS